MFSDAAAAFSSGLWRWLVPGCSELLQLIDQSEIAAEVVCLKPRHVSSCVADTQHRDVRDIACEKATT